MWYIIGGVVVVIVGLLYLASYAINEVQREEDEQLKRDLEY